ncbi:hypothetical protein GGI13_002152 [Coemansia sp. RSA 455]|nr:hypothetical protein GGI13_002152 [Coemansia sp. RSA 455]
MREQDIELYGTDIVCSWEYKAPPNISSSSVPSSSIAATSMAGFNPSVAKTKCNWDNINADDSNDLLLASQYVDDIIELPLGDNQRMALLRVCLIGDKHRSRGEAAMSTTMLLTSTAFRHMDKGDVMDTILSLVVEYYGIARIVVQ